MATKYIFITGGVTSSIGKGMLAAAMGRLLKSRGLVVAMQKVDSYLNLDPSQIDPRQYGEVFVTDDGLEATADLGNYERFVDVILNQYASVSSGSLHQRVFENEKAGVYKGETIQYIPHVTDEIKKSFKEVGDGISADVTIIEVSGTVGDMANNLFMEAIRQMIHDVGKSNVLCVHVSLVPFLNVAKELKTGPTQRSVRELHRFGIHPDILIGRVEHILPEAVRKKLSIECDVPVEAVFEMRNESTDYSIPLRLHEQGVDDWIVDYFGWQVDKSDLSTWEALEYRVKHLDKTIKVALVDQYANYPKAHLSIIEGLKHAGYVYDAEIVFDYIDSTMLTKENYEKKLSSADCILIPSNINEEKLDGKLLAVHYARENKVPYLGIGTGLQYAVIEFARYVAGIKQANSEELDSQTSQAVVIKLPMPDESFGYKGDLRIGSHVVELTQDTLVSELYNEYDVQQEVVEERHRHRFCINNDYRNQLEKAGMIISGVDPEEDIIEVIELTNHPFFVGVQFNPGFTSRPYRPHPIFTGFVGATIRNIRQIERDKKTFS